MNVPSRASSQPDWYTGFIEAALRLMPAVVRTPDRHMLI